MANHMCLKTNAHHNIKKVIFIVFLAVLIILIFLYTFNYTNKLKYFSDAITENKIIISSEYSFIARKDIKTMLAISKSNNIEHYKKYKRVLLLPTPYYFMSDYQKAELLFGAYSTDDINTIMNNYKTKTITVDKNLTIVIE